MSNLIGFHFLGVMLALAALTAAGAVLSPAQAQSGSQEPAAWPKVDAHAHVMSIRPQDEAAWLADLERWNIKWLTICTAVDDSQHLRRQVETAARLHAAHPERLAWVTTFPLYEWGRPGWQEKALAALRDGFERGAVGVKVWKDIGMLLRDPDGGYVQIDDPRFGPLLDYIESQGRTLVAHIAEPRSCWLPLDKMLSPNDSDYYGQHPQYHAFLHPEMPDYWTIIAARDRMLAAHPRLRVVGCHLASLEFDVDEVAARLERYPNLAVDLAERVYYLQLQDRKKVRDFVLKYQDRILYGTDLVVDSAGDPTRPLAASLARTDSVYAQDIRYFATDGLLTDWKVPGQFQGLALPDSVLKKLFCDNAKTWFPGI
ncbi:amidohydrolase [bacterium]|nr:amidohydrolase [bacterium]